MVVVLVIVCMPLLIRMKTMGWSRKMKKKKAEEEEKEEKKNVIIISRVLDQNSISQACYIVEIHHSGPEPSICTTD